MPPVCVKCQIEMRCKKNGKPAELMSSGAPYQLWMTDMWACPQCAFEVIAGFGKTPLAEHFQRNYNEIRESYNAADGPVVQYWSNMNEKPL